MTTLPIPRLRPTGAASRHERGRRAKCEGLPPRNESVGYSPPLVGHTVSLQETDKFHFFSYQMPRNTRAQLVAFLVESEDG
jgi:hypothetical protein